MISDNQRVVASLGFLLCFGLAGVGQAQTVRFGLDGGAPQVTTFTEFPGPFLVGLIADDVRSEPLVVRYRTFAGSAIPGEDYVEVDTTHTFDVIRGLPRHTAFLEIELLDDRDLEAAEFLTLRIEVESGGEVVGPDSLTFVVIDDDGPFGELLLSKGDNGHLWGDDS